MPIPFDKYKKYGAYHWEWYETMPKYRAHVDRVVDWVKEKNVLDIGAGDGLITDKLGADGIDNDETGVKLAQERDVNVILGDAHNMPFVHDEFESAFMGDTLEHLEFPLKALQEARRVITKYLYITGPYRRGLEAFDYPTADWTVGDIIKNVESAGFKLEGEIELIGKHSKRLSFYAKFKKI